MCLCLCLQVLTGHCEGSAGLAGLLQVYVSLSHVSAPPLRMREMNPYVAEIVGQWQGPGARMPIGAGAATGE